MHRCKEACTSSTAKTGLPNLCAAEMPTNAHRLISLFTLQELDEMNAKREAEFEEARKREVARDERKQKQTAKHKAAILQQLLKKRQKVGS